MKKSTVLALAVSLLSLPIAWATNKLTSGLNKEKNTSPQTQPIVMELTAENAQAVLTNIPTIIIVDFYADWCESCVEMERKVFNAVDVQMVLRNFVMIRADLTKNSAEDQAILQSYNVIAPPTVLLFNQQGVEQDSLRMVGIVSADEFKSHIGVFAHNYCAKDAVC